MNAIRAEFLRRRGASSAEAKWNSTRKGSLEKHRSLVHWAFSLIEKRQLLFHCILVDFERFDHSLRADGGRSESLKRMYYQLILHRLCKKHGKTYDLYAYVDRAKELVGLDALKRGLNSDADKRFGCSQSVKAIEFRNSEAEPMLQINDLILGAICAHKNRRFDDAGAGQPKANLAGFVLGRSKLVHYDSDTPKSVEDFTIWTFKSEHLKGVGV